MKNALLSLANVVGGTLLGTAAGAAAAALLAPRSGPQMQRLIKERVEEARQARAAAKKETEERLWQKFHQDVSRSSGKEPATSD